MKAFIFACYTIWIDFEASYGTQLSLLSSCLASFRSWISNAFKYNCTERLRELRLFARLPAEERSLILGLKVQYSIPPCQERSLTLVVMQTDLGRLAISFGLKVHYSSLVCT
jgi:hypothetical protein